MKYMVEKKKKCYKLPCLPLVLKISPPLKVGFPSHPHHQWDQSCKRALTDDVNVPTVYVDEQTIHPKGNNSTSMQL